MSPKNNHDPTMSSDSGNANVQEADLREMEDVNQSLDALSCALDAVEQRTDDIMSQLRELLNSNREIRRQLAEQKDQSGDQGNVDDDKNGQQNNDNVLKSNDASCAVVVDYRDSCCDPSVRRSDFLSGNLRILFF
ncbi:blast:UPF0184 protein CG14818 [Drosophila guanche]|uniref:Blast:UPF0184 protein CG14818 n=2 Tax=Drosophila guanche TaxID=7266 RepID=A0A3B0KX54_DROGU|nr:blast:UPF0184 protein CG14818 [Drosophila guanche]